MKSWVLVTLLVAGIGPASAEERSSSTEVNRLQAQCGDDVLCYFSQEEVREALGDKSSQMVNSGLFEIGEEGADGGAHGSYDQITDFSARKKTTSTKSKGKGKSRRQALSMNASANSGAPIWGSFISNFRKCAPGCVPANIITFGNRNNYSPTAGVGNFSCHPTGQAVDIGAIVCGGQAHFAIDNGRFAKFVSCMKPKMKTLFHNKSLKKYGKTQGHYDHAHFSNGCVAADGNRWI